MDRVIVQVHELFLLDGSFLFLSHGLGFVRQAELFRHQLYFIELCIFLVVFT